MFGKLSLDLTLLYETDDDACITGPSTVSVDFQLVPRELLKQLT